MPDLVLAAAAALAVWSWSAAARAGRPLRPRHALGVVGWALFTGAGRLLHPATSEPAGQVLADALVLVGAVLATYVAATIVRLVVPQISLGAALAEAVLAATSVVTLAWVLSGASPDPDPHVLTAAAPALLDLVAVALLLRLPAAIPGMAARSPHKIALATAPVLLMFLADGLHLLEALGKRPPGALEPLLAATVYLLLTVSARIKRIRSAAELAPPWLRALPYALVTSAVIAVCVQASTGGSGPGPVVLVSVVVASLVALQALGLRENTRLLADLEVSRQRLAALIENTSDLIVRLDENGRVLAANAAAVRLLHRTPVSLSGRSFETLARAEDRRRVREVVLAVARGRQDAASVELRLASPATGTAQLRLRSVPGGAVANLNDVTDAVRLRQRLERMARYDQMTGLLNRTHVLEVVGGWLTEHELPVAVLYADLDGFKAVNDRFGHAAGDRVLRDVASRLETLAGLSSRRTIVGRIGGDEFVLALEGADPAAARAAAARVVESLSPPFTLLGRTVQLGVSVGVAGAGSGYPGSVGTGEGGAAELVHRADLAMYAAKSAGRARVGEWEPALEERARRRVDIAIGLRGALDTGSLGLAYQPIVDLATGVVVGVEALLRLPPGFDAATMPGLDALVTPAELVAVAEDTGTITEMGQWVLARAAQQAALWARAGYDISVNVNMSVTQLLAPDFVDSVKAALHGCDLPASRLVLELTESQLAGQPGPAVSALQRLRDAGIRLAIDDFGTGYSSLSYLRHLPVQAVKIDRSLLDGIAVDQRAQALVRSIITMARELDLFLVAEGLEDLATARLVRDLGAHAGQGYALSPALPASQLTRVLSGAPMDLGQAPSTGGPRSALSPNGAAGAAGAAEVQVRTS